MTPEYLQGFCNRNRITDTAKKCRRHAGVKADLLFDRLSSESGGESLLKGPNKAVQRGEHRSGCSSCQLGKQEVARHLHIIVVLHVEIRSDTGQQPCGSATHSLEQAHALSVDTFNESPRQQMQIGWID